MQTNKNNKTYVLIFALFCFLLNGVIPYLSASKTSSAFNNSQNDVVLICTGGEYKWASQSLFEQTGRLIFVDNANGEEPNIAHVECPLSIFFTLFSDVSTHSAIPKIESNLFSYAEYFSKSNVYLSVKFLLNFQRGPPITLS